MFSGANQVCEATKEATPFMVLLFSSSCGPAQGQPYPETGQSQQAAPPSQTLLIPNNLFLVSRVSPSGKHPHGT